MYRLKRVKEDKTYVFIYNDEGRKELLQVLEKYANDKNLSFTWCDAAVLGLEVREI